MAAGRLFPKACKGHQARRDRKDQQERRAIGAIKASRGFKGFRGRRVRPETLDPRGRRAGRLPRRTDLQGELDGKTVYADEFRSVRSHYPWSETERGILS